MILTCPKCASRYLVPDDKVGMEGRAVRCAKCGNKWTAYNDQPAPVEDETPSVFADVEPATDDDIEAELNEISSAPAEEAPPLKVDPRRKVRHAAMTGAVWAGTVGLIVVALVLAVVFRQAVVHAVPRTAGIYAMLGMPVNNVGLVIEDLKAKPSMEEGRAALTVSGVLRNIRDASVTAPPLQVALFNPQGKRVAGKLVSAADPVIPAGQTRHFAIVILDPPSTARDLEIRFDLDGAAAAHAPVAPAEEGHAEAPALRGAKTKAHGAPEAQVQKASHD
ncbi:DUF3426 domain-containing protein [Caulobacter segnis]|uniref:DUF3426 domain-containing protein n=1 Tax=Caulobacter segnis TaxID=88688 RepID=UPI002410AB6B|nr:DUF3426 domain-containing protein [Caulobacter segnis]MDG2523159.1 DUF3426 domain-containing protein [Caulobacter segnis]